MTKRPKKYEPPLALDMDFGEALARFGQVDKKEADALAEKARTKRKEPKAMPPAPEKKSKGD